MREFFDHTGLKTVVVLIMCVLLGFSGVAIAEAPDEKAPAEKVDHAALKNPVPFTKRSISRGRMTFVRRCAECHGPDGKTMIEVIADATNLTAPKLWFNGTKEGEIYRSIWEGVGESMPSYKMQINKKEDVWHLVNFIQNLWPKSLRPELVEEARDQGEKPDGENSSEDGGNSHE